MGGRAVGAGGRDGIGSWPGIVDGGLNIGGIDHVALADGGSGQGEVGMRSMRRGTPLVAWAMASTASSWNTGTPALASFMRCWRYEETSSRSRPSRWHRTTMRWLRDS